MTLHDFLGGRPRRANPAPPQEPWSILRRSVEGGDWFPVASTASAKGAREELKGRAREFEDGDFARIVSALPSAPSPGDLWLRTRHGLVSLGDAPDPAALTGPLAPYARLPHPLGAYLDEEFYIEDEPILLALLSAEAADDPGFSCTRRLFPGGALVYTTLGGPTRALGHRRKGVWREDAPEHVYARDDKDGTFSRQTAQEFLVRRAERGDRDRYDPEPDAALFWQGPVELLHGTRDLAGVLARGIEPRDETRGMRNRSMGPAVFATTDNEAAWGYAQGPQGGVVRIDTRAMLRDGLTPRVANEPGIEEYEWLSGLANWLGTEWLDSVEGGVDPETLILFDRIPPQYLRAVPTSERP